jgi:exosome complex RNA-binding protein Rrp4
MEWWIELDRFGCTDHEGNAIDVIKRQQMAEDSVSLAQNGAIYVTTAGESLERLDSRTFRCSTGDLLTRRASRTPRG